MNTDLNTLADTYLRHHALKNNEDWWAWAEVQRRVETDVSTGWEITKVLVEKADDSALGYVAAGPLEDLIDGYGDAALDIIENACDTDPRLQLALSGVWLSPNSPVLQRWRGLVRKYGFVNGDRQPLSPHPDCWPTE